MVSKHEELDEGRRAGKIWDMSFSAISCMVRDGIEVFLAISFVG